MCTNMQYAEKIIEVNYIILISTRMYSNIWFLTFSHLKKVKEGGKKNKMQMHCFWK